MRFIPSISASNISNRWRKDLDCWVCSTRILVELSKIMSIVVSVLWTSAHRTSAVVEVASGGQVRRASGEVWL